MSAPTSPVLPTLTDAQRSGVLARLDRFIDRSGGPDACHPWTGGSLVRGYGALWVRLPDGTRRMVKAHRLALEAATGEAPAAVDHTCHDPETCPSPGLGCPHRRCCNPAHLEGVTVAENTRRARVGVYGRKCRRGHPAASGDPNGERRCRACDAEAEDRHRARQAPRPRQADKPSAPYKQMYRPQGMTLPQLVAWGLEGNAGDGCWTWRDGHPGNAGYITVRLAGRASNVPAHRLVHEVLVGPVPAGKSVVHTCHDPEQCGGGYTCPHRACVNPAHLRIGQEGRSRRPRAQTCIRGHAFTPENTRVSGRGVRSCRACALERDAAARAAAASAVDGRARAGGVCRNGHDTAVAGLTTLGRCRGCAREANARWKARQAATAGTVGG